MRKNMHSSTSEMNEDGRISCLFFCCCWMSSILQRIYASVDGFMSEVLDCLYANNFKIGKKEVECSHSLSLFHVFISLLAQKRLLLVVESLEKGWPYPPQHLAALCYITYHFCLLTRKVPYMFLGVCCNSAEGSCLPLRGLTQVKAVQTLSEPKYDMRTIYFYPFSYCIKKHCELLYNII